MCELVETLASGRILMRICPIWLPGCVSLCKKAVYGWLDDHAATMGAAIAYYMVFSLAPMLVMVIGVAGLAFGREAAEGALFGELAELIGPESAEAVQAMLRSASGTRSGIVATAIGIGTLIIAATAVFGQQEDLSGVVDPHENHNERTCSAIGGRHVAASNVGADEVLADREQQTRYSRAKPNLLPFHRLIREYFEHRREEHGCETK